MRQRSTEEEEEEEAGRTGLSAKVLFALEWAATYSSISPSPSLRLSPCLPVTLKWRRMEKRTLEGGSDTSLSPSLLYIFISPPHTCLFPSASHAFILGDLLFYVDDAGGVRPVSGA